MPSAAIGRPASSKSRLSVGATLCPGGGSAQLFALLTMMPTSFVDLFEVEVDIVHVSRDPHPYVFVFQPQLRDDRDEGEAEQGQSHSIALLYTSLAFDRPTLFGIHLEDYIALAGISS